MFSPHRTFCLGPPIASITDRETCFAALIWIYFLSAAERPQKHQHHRKAKETQSSDHRNFTHSWKIKRGRAYWPASCVDKTCQAVCWTMVPLTGALLEGWGATTTPALPTQHRVGPQGSASPMWEERKEILWCRIPWDSMKDQSIRPTGSKKLAAYENVLIPQQCPLMKTYILFYFGPFCYLPPPFDPHKTPSACLCSNKEENKDRPPLISLALGTTSSNIK